MIHCAEFMANVSSLAVLGERSLTNVLGVQAKAAEALSVKDARCRQFACHSGSMHHEKSGRTDASVPL